MGSPPAAQQGLHQQSPGQILLVCPSGILLAYYTYVDMQHTTGSWLTSLPSRQVIV